MLWEPIESALGLEKLSKLDGHILGTSKFIKSNPIPLLYKGKQLWLLANAWSHWLLGIYIRICLCHLFCV